MLGFGLPGLRFKIKMDCSAFGFIGTGFYGVALVGDEGIPARSDAVVPVQCPLQEMKVQKNTVDLLPKLKSMALADRAVFEKGMKAFVSFVQAYAKHECNLIFRLKGKLDFFT